MRRIFVEIVLTLTAVLVVRLWLADEAASAMPTCVPPLLRPSATVAETSQPKAHVWSKIQAVFPWLGARQDLARVVVPAELVPGAQTTSVASAFARLCSRPDRSSVASTRTEAAGDKAIVVPITGSTVDSSCSVADLAAHERKLAFYQQAADVFTTLVLTVWLALQWIKVPGPVTTALVMSTATWTLWFAYIGALPFAPTAAHSWAKSALWLALAYLVGIVLLRVVNFGAALWVRRSSGTVEFYSGRSAVSVWLFPALCLMLGAGTVWLLDLFAHGCANYWRLNMAQTHLTHDVATGLMVLTMTAAVAPLLVKYCMRVLNWFDVRLLAGDGATVDKFARRFGIAVFLAALIFWAVCIPFIKTLVGPAVLAEWVRLPLWLGLAWFAYRRTEKAQVDGASLAWVVVWAGAMIGVTVFVESGQALLNIGLMLLFLTVWAQPLYRRAPLLSRTHTLIQRIVLVTFGLTAGYVLLTRGAPLLPANLLSHVQLRVHALDHPFATFDSYLATLRWIGAAADAWGFGVGKVPWCGNYSALVNDCMGGVPYQIQSDYSYIGLVAVWGYFGALALVVLMVLWLYRFAKLWQGSFLDEKFRGASPQLFLGWVITVFATGMFLQIVLTVTGSQGTFPMTGVTLPWVAWGWTQMLVACFFTGLGLFRLGDVRRISPLGNTPRTTPPIVKEKV